MPFSCGAWVAQSVEVWVLCWAEVVISGFGIEPHVGSELGGVWDSLCLTPAPPPTHAHDHCLSLKYLNLKNTQTIESCKTWWLWSDSSVCARSNLSGVLRALLDTSRIWRDRDSLVMYEEGASIQEGESWKS